MRENTDQAIYRQTFPIRSYEISAGAHLTVAMMCNFLQEAASNHADELKLGYKELLTQGLFWVLAELSISVFAPMPSLNDSVEVQTRPTGFDRYFAFRDFEVATQNFGPIAKAKTRWMLVNIESRKPSVVPPWMRERLILDIIKGAKTPRFAIKKVDFETQFRVRYSDLDVNEHANNVKMIEWILESVPFFIEPAHVLTKLNLIFRAEARYNETVLVRSSKIDDTPLTYHHELLVPQRNQVIAAARTEWKP